MIRYIIIEDQPAAFKHLKEILDAEYKEELDFIGTADAVHNGIKLINDVNPDLIFMDIELKDGLAFDLLDHFSSAINFEIIFTSGHIDYREKSMDYFAFYFLNKPIFKEKLRFVMTKYLTKKTAFDLEKYLVFKDQINAEKKTIALPLSNGQFSVIVLDDLIYCEADGSYTHYYTSDNKKYISSNNLKKVEDLLCNSSFYRIHRSVLLNLKHIKQYNVNGKLTLTNNKSVNVSHRNKKGFFKIVKLMNYTID
jgi:two-component system LytT family response regulator